MRQTLFELELETNDPGPTPSIGRGHGIYLTRIYGGEARGLCYQLTLTEPGSHLYVQLTRAEFLRFATAVESERASLLAARVENP